MQQRTEGKQGEEHEENIVEGMPPSIAGMIAVSAMACQFSLLRLAVPGAPSTAVMTGNPTKTVLSLLDTLSQRPVVEDAREQLKKTLQLIAPFFIGKETQYSPEV
jgi:uncharacterized membrane protein YoaK (UPF0700 family)